MNTATDDSLAMSNHSTPVQLADGHRVLADEALREQLFLSHLPTARQLAEHCGADDQPLQDVVTLTAVALVKALDDFDDARGVSFASHAFATVLVELDRRRAPRFTRGTGVRGLAARVEEQTDALTTALGRPPSVGELADAVQRPSDA